MYFFALAGVVMAVYFVAAAWRRPRPAEFLAVILWAAYCVYEYFVANGTLCDANCNIRVDLVFFFPLLGCATYLALQKEPRTGAAAILAVICLAIVAWLASVVGNVACGSGRQRGCAHRRRYGIKSRFTNRP